MKKIGVLALQGAFIEHIRALEKIGVEAFEIRQRKDIDQSFDGLILPGGESTTMGKLLHDLSLFTPLQNKIKNGLPTFGTCAGMILLAKEVDDNPAQLGIMDIRVKRNAYGRQLGSFYIDAPFGNIGNVPMPFIRAPYIVSTTSDDVKILATVHDKAVAAIQKNCLATAFHPELSDSTAIHQYFLDNCF